MRTTRHLLSYLFAALAGLAPGAAAATDAAATTWLNVRSGPGTSYGVVDTLAAGEVVTVTECETNGWCYIEHSGPDGWVSSTYLTVAPDTPGGSDPDCRLQLTIGPEGPRLALQCGDGPIIGPGPGPGPGPSGTQACFYRNANYGGASFCRGVGTMNALTAAFDNRITSVRISGPIRVRLCVDTNLGGYCRIVTGDTPQLGPLIDNRASSLRVYTTPGPVTPLTYSTGPIDLPQTYTANLDNGAVGGPGVDIWYRAVNPFVKFIAPRNGAQLARGDGSNRGYAGCSAESFSSAQIPLGSIPPGTYVCVRTNAGRISQFRVNGFAGTTMRIGYTTWAN